MIIKNVSLVIFYCLWIYLLILLLIRHTIFNRKYHRQKNVTKELISKFEDVKEDIVFTKKVKKYVLDNEYLSFLLQLYSDKKDTYNNQQKNKIQQFFLQVIEYRISMLDSKDTISRCLIMKMIYICNVKSKTIQEFMSYANMHNKLEMIWMDQYDRVVGE